MINDQKQEDVKENGAVVSPTRTRVSRQLKEEISEKHKDCTRGFTQLSKAWYSKSNLEHTDIIDVINIGFYHNKGGTTGEFSVEWKRLGGLIVPKLEAFDDGWNALFYFSDLLECMANVDDENISPDGFATMLTELGIANNTETLAPSNELSCAENNMGNK